MLIMWPYDCHFKDDFFFYLHHLSRSFNVIVSVYMDIDSKGVYSALIYVFQHSTALAKEQPLQIASCLTALSEINDTQL
jgi:hypothetical protein